MWELWPVLTVTHSASVSLSGTHTAESNKQLPISSPLVVLAAHSASIQAYLPVLSFVCPDLGPLPVWFTLQCPVSFFS